MARTIGVKNKNLIKRLVLAEQKNGIVNRASSVQAVLDQLPVEMWDTWESAHDEINRIVDDGITNAFYSRSGM